MGDKERVRGGMQKGFMKSAFVPLLIFILSAGLAGFTFMLPTVFFARSYVDERLYLYGTASQLIMDLPAVLLLLRSQWQWLGDRDARASGIAAGLIGALILGGVRYLLRGRLIFMEQVPAFGQALALPLPWNLLGSMMTVIAYGPGEALIQVYLVLAIDDATGNRERLLSPGIVANAWVWGLGHIAAVIRYGWSAVVNALLMLIIGLVTGVMFMKTKSATAPVVFWTLINGTSI